MPDINGSDNNRNAAIFDRDVAEAQRDAAAFQATTEHVRRTEAENERDLAIQTANENAVLGSAAVNIADAETIRRHQADTAAMNARIAANQAQSTSAQRSSENMVLREDLAHEREVASNSNFGLVLICGVVVVALIGFGIWYFTNQTPSTVAVITPTANTTSVVTPHTPRAAAAAAPTVRPTINVNVTTPPPAPSPKSAPSTPSDSSGQDANGVSPPAQLPSSGSGTSDKDSTPATDDGSSTTSGGSGKSDTDSGGNTTTPTPGKTSGGDGSGG